VRVKPALSSFDIRILILQFPFSNFEIRSLYHATFRRPDEFHQGPDVFGLEGGRLDGFPCLGGVQLGSGEQAEGTFQFLQVVSAQAASLEP
jgi:hypothetical protein